jgi:hypothetical protein
MFNSYLFRDPGFLLITCVHFVLVVEDGFILTGNY